MKVHNYTFRKTALAAAVVLAVGGGLALEGFIDSTTGVSGLVSSAYADEGGSAGGKKGAMGDKRGGQGGQGAGGQGHRGGKSMTDLLSDEGDTDSDRPEWAQSPGRDGKPGGGSAGGDTQKGTDYGDLFVILRNDDGTPVTVGNEVYILLSNGEVVLTEGGEVPAGVDASLLQPVEFGRMNIARAPASVLEHSLTEALSKLDGLSITPDNVEEYTDAGGRLTVDGATIDSPLENLALYEALLTAKDTDGDGLLELTATSSHDGADVTFTVEVDPAVRMDLAAAAIAASSDKTGELTIDELVVISSFIGVDDELGQLVADYTYDPSTAYAGETVYILVDQGDGVTFVKTEVSLLDVVEFNTVERPYLDDGQLTIDDNSTGIDVFTQAADDAVQVIEYVHEFAVE